MSRTTINRSQSGEFTVSDLNAALTAEGRTMEKFVTGITIGAVAFFTLFLMFAGFVI